MATYVDDVYMPSGYMNSLDFNSIERVEVLKGPQGTLFGRNATGGVLSITTRDPTPQPEMDADVGYGKYQTITGDFYATSRIVDDLSANISLHENDQREGWGVEPIHR